MRTDSPPQTKYLKDYQPFPYSVENVNLSFDLQDGKTIVTCRATYRLKDGNAPAPLVLNGETLILHSVDKDGKTLDKSVDYSVDEAFLTIHNVGSQCVLTIITEIDPAANTTLEGLYMSGGIYCTQCEAEGFRRITYFPDRPDVLSTFSVRIEADKQKYPVLLSNGNLDEEGDLKDGRHYAVFNDPTPKPCYLFALVAGNLVHKHDTFTTMSGQKVDLYIYVRAGDEHQVDHALNSLIKSMKWDEDVYGREYQYNRFNIVAVSDFNMGAMENTSLNIFNTALALAHPDTATDSDFYHVEAVIGHEYFHNWTGNRVTCRDWFQLSLKEGLTVFRDQEFSGDMNSKSVQRIDDVMNLRARQFPEDASPLAHPIRPDNYIEIDNFYTMTVYEKGAEVIRMQHTLLGDETYRKATDLYFDRFDGQAVTCEDFVQCMQDASGQDLSQFKLWYSQAGTPQLTASGTYDEATKTYTLTLKQTVPPTAGQPHKKPMHMPVKIGLVGPNGQDMHAETLHLKEAEQTFVFKNIGSKPVPSILRGFSAPVKLSTDLSSDDLQFLMVHDADGFNKWEAGQTYAMRVIQDMLDAESDVPEAFIRTYGDLLTKTLDPKEDKALSARMLALPDITRIGQDRAEIDPTAIHMVRETLLKALLSAHSDKVQQLYDDNQEHGAYEITPEAMGRRALKNAALSLLCIQRTQADAARAKSAYDSATNMTDRFAAMAILTHMTHPQKAEALADFHARFKNYPLVVDKWFSVQAVSLSDDVLAQLNALKTHPDFNIKNPNRARSLYGAFAMNNPVQFHRADGAGYSFLKEAVITLEKINPMIAARLLTPLREWRKYTPDRQAKMKAALEDIKSLPGLSTNVFEIASKSLEG